MPAKCIPPECTYLIFVFFGTPPIFCTNSILVGVLRVLVGEFLYRDGVLNVFGITMVYLLHEIEHLVFGMMYR